MIIKVQVVTDFDIEPCLCKLSDWRLDWYGEGGSGPRLQCENFLGKETCLHHVVLSQAQRIELGIKMLEQAYHVLQAGARSEVERVAYEAKMREWQRGQETLAARRHNIETAPVKRLNLDMSA